MKKLILPILVTLLVVFYCDNILAQTNNNTRASNIVTNENENPRFLNLSENTIDKIFLHLKDEVMKSGQSEKLVLSDLEIEKFINVFHNNIEAKNTNELSLSEVKTKVNNLIGKARNTLKSLNNAKNFTLIDAQSFYGDDYKLTKVVSLKIEVIDKNEQPNLYEFVFVEINEHYRIFAIN